MYDKLYFVMDESKTVYYQFGSEVIYGLEGHNYSYICGGQNTSAIDRFSFSLDQGSSIQVGGLSDQRNETSANNSSTHAYVCGGRKSTVIQDIIDRLLFPLDTGNAVNFANMNVSKYATSTNNSSCGGYIYAGSDNTDYVDSVEKYDFSLISITTNVIGSISNRRNYSSANNSSIYSYIYGGIENLNLSNIDRFSFSLDSGEHTIFANLSTTKAYLAANNSSQFGYVCGGSDENIEKIDFSLDTGISSLVATVGSNREFISANNSTTHGYICGGQNSSIINRFTFPLDSGEASTYSELTSDNRTKCSAADGVDFVKIFEPIDEGPGPSGCEGLQYDPATGTGYYGETTSAELISGDDLAAHLGLTAGISHNSNSGWLKYFDNGDVKFVAKKTFRYSLSWNDIYDVGAVYGSGDAGPYNNTSTGVDVIQDAQIEIDGRQYMIMLLTGAYENPFQNTDLIFDCSTYAHLGEESEWNELIYRIASDNPDCGSDGNPTQFHGGSQVGDNWDNISQADINVGTTGNGIASWTQETLQTNTNYKVRRGRGFGGVSGFGATVADDTDVMLGWRPILVLIQS